ETQLLRSLEHFGGFEGIADRINRYNHHLKNPDYLAEDIQRYRTVTPEKVQQFAQTYLGANARVVVEGVPGEPDFGTLPPTPPPAKSGAKLEGEAVNADEPWRSDKPAGGKPAEVKIPAPESFRLSNGLTVLLNQRKGIPIVSSSILFRSGSGANPPNQP